MRVRTKRIYGGTSRMDGYRVFVDRLWPRGISKADADLDEWAKGLAPSDDLRKWFGHDADRWDEFRKCYIEELTGKKEEIESLVKNSPKKTITLLFAAKDEGHNNAVVLKEYIETKILG